MRPLFSQLLTLAKAPFATSAEPLLIVTNPAPGRAVAVAKLTAPVLMTVPPL